MSCIQRSSAPAVPVNANYAPSYMLIAAIPARPSAALHHRTLERWPSRTMLVPNYATPQPAMPPCPHYQAPHPLLPAARPRGHAPPPTPPRVPQQHGPPTMPEPPTIEPPAVGAEVVHFKRATPRPSIAKNVRTDPPQSRTRATTSAFVVTDREDGEIDLKYYFELKKSIFKK